MADLGCARPFTLGALALALSASSAASADDRTCYDRAVVGALTKQTCLGSPQVAPGELSLDCVFEWRVRVRKRIVGPQPPTMLTLRTVAHTYLAPAAAKRVALFLKVADGGEPLLVSWQVIPQHLGPSDWLNRITAAAREMDLAECPLPTRR